MAELLSTTLKVIGRTLVPFDRMESIIPLAVVADKIAQLRIDVSVILERRNALSSVIGLGSSRVTERLAPLQQKSYTTPVYASGLRRRRQPAKKKSYLSDTNSGHSKDSLTTESEEELQLIHRPTQHRRHPITYIVRRNRVSVS